LLAARASWIDLLGPSTSSIYSNDAYRETRLTWVRMSSGPKVNRRDKGGGGDGDAELFEGRAGDAGGGSLAEVDVPGGEGQLALAVQHAATMPDGNLSHYAVNHCRCGAVVTSVAGERDSTRGSAEGGGMRRGAGMAGSGE
jgi:hypothetical protein